MIDLLAAAIADSPPAIVRAAEPPSVPTVCACGDDCGCNHKAHKQAADITKLIAENKQLKADLAFAISAVAPVPPPAVEPPPTPVEPVRGWLLAANGVQVWGWMDGGVIRYFPAEQPAPAAQPVRVSAPSSCYTNARGQRVCPR
jgi:hypothetical protein